MIEDKKRVLFIAPQPFFQWRGSPIRVGFNVQALAELGYDVDLLVMPVGEDRAIPGVKIVRVPNVFRVKNMAIGPSCVKAVYDVFLFFTAWKLARKNRYAVIHGVEDAGPIAVTIAKWTGAKAIFEKHSDPGSYKKGAVKSLIMALYAQVEKFSIRHADSVIGTGPGLVEQARAVGSDTPVYHIFDIPSSLAEAVPERVLAIRQSLLQWPDELLVMYVGSFAVYQGIDLMFRSMPEVIRKSTKARFVVIGGSPGEIAARKAWLGRRNIEENVEFLGMIPPDELPNYLSASDILLSPRIFGTNTPLKLLDYLKAGKAIVAADSTANRLILDEKTAMLVTPLPDEFARCVCRLLDNGVLRGKLGHQGRELLRERYNFNEFKRLLSVCYTALDA